MAEPAQLNLNSVALQVENMMRLAKIKYQQQDYSGAISAFDRVLSLDPNFAPGYHQRSFIYYRLEDYERALSDSDLAIACNAELACAYANRGFIRQKFEDEVDKGVSDWRKAANLFKIQGDVLNYHKMMELLNDEGGDTYSSETFFS
jgi:tetratricopeptide (TPR) repeat protein